MVRAGMLLYLERLVQRSSLRVFLTLFDFLHSFAPLRFYTLLLIAFVQPALVHLISPITLISQNIQLLQNFAPNHASAHTRASVANHVSIGIRYHLLYEGSQQEAGEEAHTLAPLLQQMYFNDHTCYDCHEARKAAYNHLDS